MCGYIRPRRVERVAVLTVSTTIILLMIYLLGTPGTPGLKTLFGIQDDQTTKSVQHQVSTVLFNPQFKILLKAYFYANSYVGRKTHW